MHSDSELVRQDLLREFCSAEGQARVTQSSFLDLECHWAAIVASLFRHNQDDLPQVVPIESFCVVGIYFNGNADQAASGIVVGNAQARRRLIVLNDRNVHFDPCLRL